MCRYTHTRFDHHYAPPSKNHTALTCKIVSQTDMTQTDRQTTEKEIASNRDDSENVFNQVREKRSQTLSNLYCFLLVFT